MDLQIKRPKPLLDTNSIAQYNLQCMKWSLFDLIFFTSAFSGEIFRILFSSDVV